MIEHDLEELDKLLASRGWQLVREALQEDITRAALGLAKSATMTMDEVHFRRGAIYACSQALNAPQLVRDQLYSTIRFKSPATAGPKG